MYIAEMQVKFAEEDDFDHGCLPATGREFVFSESFNAETLSGLLEKLSDYHDLGGIEDMDLNACDEIGRLDIQKYENDDGLALSVEEVAQWKQGKIRAWLATYTYKIIHCRPVDISTEYDQNS